MTSSSAPVTPVAEIPGIVASARAAFDRGTTRPIAWRKKQLRALYDWISKNEQTVLDAVNADLHRLNNDSYQLELLGTLSEIAHMLDHIDEWTTPKTVPGVLMTAAGTQQIRYEPLGVTLLIAPWNYPFYLLAVPLAQAICAGNACILKPSEMSTHTEALFYREIPKILDSSAIKVVTGGVAESTALLAQRFDQITYTGNGTVGRIVMTAAAKHLTPVLLELGGKCPVYVHKDADLAVATKRLMWAKATNAGQTCLAPDFVLVHRDVAAKFNEQFKKTYEAYFPKGPRAAEGYCRIINSRHFGRVKTLIDRQSACSHSKLLFGGDTDAADKYVGPTVFTGVKMSDPIMEDELFCPLLAVIEVANEDEAISLIRSRDHPLGMYIFADKPVADKILNSTTSGSAVVNDFFFHMLVPDLPFGGGGAVGDGSGLEAVNDARYPDKAETALTAFLLRRLLVGKPQSGAYRAVRWLVGKYGGRVALAAVAFWLGVVYRARTA
ncbi:Aldehyde/histidinol dehydrogenase [Zopfochytrium polystomum]|nr:Aldehyde/histidinol dehydrogenase [Zopfochytrium polystomum]